MSIHPVEVKSGKDYTVHSALNNLLDNPDYHISAATVISNERKIYQNGKITYMPVYLVMFMNNDVPQDRYLSPCFTPRLSRGAKRQAHAHEEAGSCS